MTDPTPGIHHVTCIASDPQENLDFWVETLGLRLVKRSINQDDPGTYHLFFADTVGTPGTSMTFFPWQDLPQGKVGTGQVTRTAFRVPAGSLSFWEDRFDQRDVSYDDRLERFGESVLPFRDPDGLPVELVATELPDDDPTDPWTDIVPGEYAIRGFHSVTLWIADLERTASVLETLGMERTDRDHTPGDAPGDKRSRYAAAGPVGTYVDVVPTIESARQGHGTVHHVAFQTPTDEQQAAAREAVRSLGLQPTPQIDRHWFRSVYFREFGGVLFELATNGPGYDSDEPVETLGERLVLPGDFEDRRAEIEANLPSLKLPTTDD